MPAVFRVTAEMRKVPASCHREAKKLSCVPRPMADPGKSNAAVAVKKMIKPEEGGERYYNFGLLARIGE